MITITWTDEVSSLKFEIPDTVGTSLESYRQSLVDRNVVNGEVVIVPRYATVRDMIVAIINQRVVIPAIEAFPPAPVQALKDAADQANAALEEAKAAALQFTIVEQA